MTSFQNLVVTALTVAALAAVVAIGYETSPLPLKYTDVDISVANSCDLNSQGCVRLLPGGGQVGVSLTPKPVPGGAPFQIEVVISGIEVQKVEIDFAAAEMDMGLNRQVLAMVRSGLYRGTTTLPLCISGAMNWRVTLLVEASGERIAVPFHLGVPATH